MWRAQFNVADLSDIRVREYEFRRPKDGSPDDHGRIRVEVIAVCKVPPTGQGFFVRQGTLVEHVWSNAKETSEPIASSSGLAKISDRWATGEAGNQADLHPDHADRAETGEKQAQGHEGGRLRAEKCGCGTRVSRPYVGRIGRLIPMPNSRMLRQCPWPMSSTKISRNPNAGFRKEGEWPVLLDQDVSFKTNRNGNNI